MGTRGGDGDKGGVREKRGVEEKKRVVEKRGVESSDLCDRCLIQLFVLVVIVIVSFGLRGNRR